jgi:aldehyde dehydrogenase (NAD+)
MPAVSIPVGGVAAASPAACEASVGAVPDFVQPQNNEAINRRRGVMGASKHQWRAAASLCQNSEMSPSANPKVQKTPAAFDAASLVAQLRRSFESGRTRSFEWRAEQLRQLRRMFDENEGRLLEALKSDLGKPAFEGVAVELGFTANEVTHAVKQLAGWMKPERARASMMVQPASARIIREPLGVVLIIAPWNYPINLSVSPLIGALAGGNCVVVKPSELAPASSAALAELLPRYLDRECVAVVEGAVPETSALLAERFDHVFYTGNGTVGRIVMQAAAKHLTPVTLELGGKSPCIVDAEVDLDVAARRIAFGKFFNAGQTCIAPDYILCHRSVEKPFLERLAAMVKEFYGDDPRQSSDFGRIVNERHHARLTAMLSSGEVVFGGTHDAASRYIAPTVLRSVPADAPVMREEIFGPILPVLSVASIEEAITFVNQREKPLALYVFSRDKRNVARVLEATSSGGACVNDVLSHIVPPGLPFGGVGPSGMGAYHGRHTFETFTHAKSVLERSTMLDPKLRYPPYTAKKQKWVKRLI